MPLLKTATTQCHIPSKNKKQVSAVIRETVKFLTPTPCFFFWT